MCDKAICPHYQGAGPPHFEHGPDSETPKSLTFEKDAAGTRRHGDSGSDSVSRSSSSRPAAAAGPPARLTGHGRSHRVTQTGRTIMTRIAVTVTSSSPSLYHHRDPGRQVTESCRSGLAAVALNQSLVVARVIRTARVGTRRRFKFNSLFS